jgi:hypothetical protein
MLGRWHWKNLMTMSSKLGFPARPGLRVKSPVDDSCAESLLTQIMALQTPDYNSNDWELCTLGAIGGNPASFTFHVAD